MPPFREFPFLMRQEQCYLDFCGSPSETTLWVSVMYFYLFFQTISNLSYNSWIHHYLCLSRLRLGDGDLLRVGLTHQVKVFSAIHGFYTWSSIYSSCGAFEQPVKYIFLNVWRHCYALLAIETWPDMWGESEMEQWSLTGWCLDPWVTMATL